MISLFQTTSKSLLTDPLLIKDGGSLIQCGQLLEEEKLFLKQIFEHHKEFKGIKNGMIEQIFLNRRWYLVLSEDIVAIGISQRTTPIAIETIAKRLTDENE